MSFNLRLRHEALAKLVLMLWCVELSWDVVASTSIAVMTLFMLTKLIELDLRVILSWRWGHRGARLSNVSVLVL